MVKLTLKQAFESTFHEKQNFNAFLQAEASKFSSLLTFQSESRRARTYYQPNSTLKAYLRFLNQFVFSYASIVEDSVFSYRKDASVLHAVGKHAGNTCFLKTDLIKFFQSISDLDVDDIIQHRLSESPICDLCAYRVQMKRLVLIEQQLPIGLPTSPVISNSVLYAFDVFFMQWAQAHQVVYTRYSDDLIFSAQTDEELKSLPSLLDGWLASNYDGRFRLNPKKTYFTHSGQKIKILGLVLLPNGHITVSRQLKNKIEVLLHYYVKDRPIFMRLVGHHFGDANKFMGVLHYVQTVDKGYIVKLREKYGNYLVDLFLHHGAKL